MQNISRRQLIKLGLCAAATAALSRFALAAAPVRKLAFYNLHTDEALHLAYYENGRYVPSAMQAVVQPPFSCPVFS